MTPQPYQDKLWRNHPSGGTPRDADGYNDWEGRIGQGIEDAVERALSGHTSLPAEGIFNVRHLGAFGLTNLIRDNVTGLGGTDNTGRFQALVDYIAGTFLPSTGVGAVILFPPGGYGFAGPVTFPTGAQSFAMVGPHGAGRGGTRTQNNTFGQKIVRLRRIGAGGSPILTGAYDAVNLDRNPSLELRGLDIDGGKDFGLVHQPPMIRFTSAPELRVRDCKFQSNDGVSFSSAMVLNGDMAGVRVHNCGSAWVDPLDTWGVAGFTRSPAFSLAFTAAAGTNTVRLTDMEFEGNLGTDCLLYGSGSGKTVNIVLLENWKMEGFGDGGAYPYLHLENAYQIEGSNISIIDHRPNAAIFQDGAHSGDAANFPLAVNHFTNCHIHHESSVAPYAIDHAGGGLDLEQFALSGIAANLPSTAWIRRRSTVEANSYKYDCTYDDARALVGSP